MSLKTVPLNTPIPLFYTGPDLDLNQDLPCIIYLALSAKETLLTDPFNQPALFLHNSSSLRVFSVNLPFHGDEMPSTEGMKRWADEFLAEKNILTHFLDDLESSLRLLFAHINPSKIAIMGLSRGGFLASHIAARCKEISTLVAFAPLTDLGECLEFLPLKESLLVQELSLNPLTPILAQKQIKVLIGNRDLRVSTDRCYAWVRSLTEEAFSQSIRSPQIELSLKPSIGYLGHGTSKETFEEGSFWILKKLGLS